MPAGSGADRLAELYSVTDIEGADDMDEIREEVKGLREGLSEAGKSSEFARKEDWNRAIFENMYFVVPALIDYYGTWCDADLARGLEKIYDAVRTPNIDAKMGGAVPPWLELAVMYRNEPDKEEPAPMTLIDGEWMVCEGPLTGQRVALASVEEAQKAGRVMGDRAMVHHNGGVVFVMKGAKQTQPQQPAPGLLSGHPMQQGTLFGQLAQAAGLQPPGPPGLSAPTPTPQLGSVMPTGYPQGPSATGWALFSNDGGVKPEHVPNAPTILRLAANAGGSGANSARALVASSYGHLRGGSEYEQLITVATLLDSRVAQLGHLATRTVLEQDSMIEILCSEIASIDFLLHTGDVSGAAALRATLGAEAFAGGTAAIKNAYTVTKDRAKHREYRHQRSTRDPRRGGPRGKDSGDHDRDGGKGDGRGGKGDGRGGVQCHRCQEYGHPARLCTAAEPKK